MNDNKYMESFSDRLFYILEKRGISQVQLADRTGISQNAISSWKSRGTIPKADDALRIADILGVSIEYLILGTDEKKNLIERMRSLSSKQIEVIEAVISAFEKQK